MNNMITPLCTLAYKYGTDKCPQLKHSYTTFYYQLFKSKRQKIKKVLEMGIGYYPEMPQKKVIYDPGLKRNYHLGASLYMWRDFFPNAQIFGGDYYPETLFEDDRIKTYLCDERKREDVTRLIKNTGSDIDIFIDDGNHNKRRQIFLCKTLMPLLKKDVIYIIEDVRYPEEIVNSLKEYDCQVSQFPPQCIDDRLIVVRNKDESLINNPRYRKTIKYYQWKFYKKLAIFNRPAELPSYFGPMIGSKKEVTIADLGAGPICTIGNLWKDVKVRIYASDILQKEFEPIWEKYKAVPIVPVEYQDMERLTYQDEFFDIVHCENALDHTLDARMALKEMIRVCKREGWIYLRHAPDQRSRRGGIHAWDVNLVDGECIFSCPEGTFSLSEFMDFNAFLEKDAKGKHWIVAMARKNSIYGQ